MADKEGALVGREAVGPDLGLDIPSADPSIGIEEMERRRDLVANPGPDTRLPADAMIKRRDAFYAEFGGFWVINCANVEFSTKCDCPNFRILSYFGTSDAADAYIRQVMTDPRVTSIPIKAPANTAFQIPLSEATAMDGAHIMAKMNRNMKRYMDFVAYRNQEFQKHVEEKTPGETGRSTYNRRKEYLERQKNREQARDGILPAAKPLPTAESAAGGAGEATSVSAPVATDFIWKGELPSHWLKREGEVTADTWPRELEDRRGRFAVIAFIDDEDEPTDSPSYPAAAKREPIVIVFGGMHESVDAAKDFMTKNIAPWNPDVTLDVVDMYEWLWPTEVDPDAVTEQHRTANAGFDRELNTVMTQRKHTMRLAAEAREQSAAHGAPLRESNVNSLPDVDAVVSARQEGMVSYELADVGVEESKDDGLPSI